jgi:hypothetical protein
MVSGRGIPVLELDLVSAAGREEQIRADFAEGKVVLIDAAAQ